MKRYFTTIILLAAILCACNNKDNITEETNDINNAEIFLESEQYKKYEKIVKKDGIIVKNALKALTKEERNEYFTLMRSATPNTTETEYDSIFHRIYELTNIDTDKRIKKLYEAKVEMMEGVTFSKKELLKAIQRHCININKTVMTRSYDEVDRTVCMNECSAVYASVYGDCDPTGGTGIEGSIKDQQDYDLWEELRYCAMMAADAYDECMQGCE